MLQHLRMNPLFGKRLFLAGTRKEVPELEAALAQYIQNLPNKEQKPFKVVHFASRNGTEEELLAIYTGPDVDAYEAYHQEKAKRELVGNRLLPPGSPDYDPVAIDFHDHTSATLQDLKDLMVANRLFLK